MARLVLLVRFLPLVLLSLAGASCTLGSREECGNGVCVADSFFDNDPFFNKCECDVCYTGAGDCDTNLCLFLMIPFFCLICFVCCIVICCCFFCRTVSKLQSQQQQYQQPPSAAPTTGGPVVVEATVVGEAAPATVVGYQTNA